MADGEARPESAMSGGEYGLAWIGTEQLAATGTQFGLPADAAAAIVENARQRILEAFESANAAVE